MFNAGVPSRRLAPSRLCDSGRFFRPLSADGTKLSAGLNFEPALRADPAHAKVYAALGHCKPVVAIAMLHATIVQPLFCKFLRWRS